MIMYYKEDYKRKGAYLTELFNEECIMLLCICLLLLTDINDDKASRNMIGWIATGIIAINIFFNMIFMLINVFFAIKELC